MKCEGGSYGHRLGHRHRRRGVLLGFLYLGFARRVRRLGDLPQVDQNAQQRVDEDVSMWRRMQGQNTPWI
jgi:hypothetical protein